MGNLIAAHRARWPNYLVLSAAELSRVRELQYEGCSLGAISLVTGLLGRDIDLALWRGLGR